MIRRTVGGISKSLGEPRISIVPLSGVNTEIVITVAWDISWYQYRVTPDLAQPVRLAERGLLRPVQRGGRREVVEVAAGVDQARHVAQDRGIALARVALQADELHVVASQQGRQGGEGQRAVEIVVMAGAARPRNADTGSPGGKPLRPARRRVRRLFNIGKIG